MSLQISNFKPSNELVELSIDEQTEILGGLAGGFKQTPENLYVIDLRDYVNGANSVGNDGDLITFSYSGIVDAFKVDRSGSVVYASQNGRTNELFAFNPDGPIEQSILKQNTSAPALGIV